MTYNAYYVKRDQIITLLQKGKTGPKIPKMKVISVKRNMRKLFYKFSHGEDEFREVDFLPFSEENAEDLFPSAIARARGINEKKKEQNLKLLVSHIASQEGKFLVKFGSQR